MKQSSKTAEHCTGTLCKQAGRVDLSSKTAEYCNTIYARRRVTRLQNTCTHYVRTGRMEKISKTAKFWHTLCQDKKVGEDWQYFLILAHTISGLAG